MAHGDTVVAVACRRHGHAGRAATWRGQDGIGREGDGICDEKRRGLSVTARCSAWWKTLWWIGLEQRPVTRPWSPRGKGVGDGASAGALGVESKVSGRGC